MSEIFRVYIYIYINLEGCFCNFEKLGDTIVIFEIYKGKIIVWVIRGVHYSSIKM